MNDLRGKLPIHPWKQYPKRDVANIRSIAIHHSMTKTGSAESFARYHVQTNDWPGIAYAYVIDRDGTINKCWDHDVLTYHVGNSNGHALGICLVGDFRKLSKQTPTQAQYESALWLTRRLLDELPNANKVLGHIEYPGYSWKECPGFSMDQFREDLEVDELQLTESQWKMLVNALDKAPIEKQWVEKAKKRELTLSELTWLNMIVLVRK